MNIEKLSTQEFQDYMNELSTTHPDVWEFVMERYFSDVRHMSNPILESWKNDFDDVWDAQSYLQELYGSED